MLYNGEPTAIARDAISPEAVLKFTGSARIWPTNGSPAMDTFIGLSEDELDDELLSVDREAQVLDMSKYKEAVKTLPDVRKERIAELKRLIEAGEYHIDSRKIAEKILDRQIEDGSF